MKYNYKVYNNKTNEIYACGTTEGKIAERTRSEQTSYLKITVMAEILRKLNINPFTEERNNIKLSMRRED